MKEIGKIGEDLVANQLLAEGYEILERNWVFNKGEIDIIAQKSNCIHIIEVKLRKVDSWQTPVEGLTKKQMKFLIRTADYYMDKKGLDLEVQFDFYAVEQNKGKYTIHTYLKAFHPMTI